TETANSPGRHHWCSPGLLTLSLANSRRKDLLISSLDDQPIINIREIGFGHIIGPLNHHLRQLKQGGKDDWTKQNIEKGSSVREGNKKKEEKRRKLEKGN
ncbi:hypothetical protein LINPERPRIM_LOCUS1169, partial [Linum perenne]